MTINQERIDKGIQLRAWCKQDDDIQNIVAATCGANKCQGYAELAEQYPETFDELYEVVEGILEESPSIGRLPGYMQ